MVIACATRCAHRAPAHWQHPAGGPRTASRRARTGIRCTTRRRGSAARCAAAPHRGGGGALHRVRARAHFLVRCGSVHCCFFALPARRAWPAVDPRQSRPWRPSREGRRGRGRPGAGAAAPVVHARRHHPPRTAACIDPRGSGRLQARSRALRVTPLPVLRARQGARRPLRMALSRARIVRRAPMRLRSLCLTSTSPVSSIVRDCMSCAA